MHIYDCSFLSVIHMLEN